MRALTMFLTVAMAGVLAADDEAPLPEVAAAFARIEKASTVEITTTGRKSGKERTTPVWFVVTDGKMLLQSGQDGKTDWYQNLEKNPALTVRQGGYLFRARVTRKITDPDEVERVHRLFLDKYTSARLLSWVGSSIGRGRPVELTVDAVSIVR